MISVIIPCYNVEKYLDKCLHSVLTNTYRDLEVICVNDGSTDSSLKILQKWQAKDSRIVLVSHENRGLPEARNSGLDVATGDYTAFIDADDWVHPRYFESMLTCMEENDADMVVCGVQKFELGEEVEVKPTLRPKYQKLTDEQFYKSYFARHMIWGRLLKRRDTMNLRFPTQVSAMQDTLYNLRITASLKHPNIYETKTPMYYYLQRPGSLVSSHPYETKIEMAKWCVKNGLDPRHEKTGNWGWQMVMQSISTVLNCRYEASLRNNKSLVNYTNKLLKSLYSDLLRDRCVRFDKKLVFTVMALLPKLYRLFKLINDPTMVNHERLIRML